MKDGYKQPYNVARMEKNSLHTHQQSFYFLYDSIVTDTSATLSLSHVWTHQPTRGRVNPGY